MKLLNTLPTIEDYSQLSEKKRKISNEMEDIIII